MEASYTSAASVAGGMAAVTNGGVVDVEIESGMKLGGGALQTSVTIIIFTINLFCWIFAV